MQEKNISSPIKIHENKCHMTAMQSENKPRDCESESCRRRGREVSFKVTHSRHHNVKIIPFSTGT